MLLWDASERWGLIPKAFSNPPCKDVKFCLPMGRSVVLMELQVFSTPIWRRFFSRIEMQVTFIKQPRASLAVRWMIVLCLALVAFAAGAQALHYHADQSAEAAKHCSLCLVMHSAP